MLTRLIVGFLALASAAHSEGATTTTTTTTTTGPVLVGGETRPECRAALDMATDAFRSTSPVLIWPVPQPDAGLATLALRRKDRDISGGDGIWADPAVFERLQLDEPPFDRTIFYWQREARGGRQILVVEEPFNWQGSWYYLFLLDPALLPERFAQDYFAALKAGFRQPEDAPPILTPLLYTSNLCFSFQCLLVGALVNLKHLLSMLLSHR